MQLPSQLTATAERARGGEVQQISLHRQDDVTPRATSRIISEMISSEKQ